MIGPERERERTDERQAAAALHDAPGRGQRDHSQPDRQAHSGAGGAAERGGVALVRRAAGDFLFVGEHHGAVGGGVAAGGLAAAQREEAHVGERRETCGDTESVKSGFLPGESGRAGMAATSGAWPPARRSLTQLGGGADAGVGGAAGLGVAHAVARQAVVALVAGQGLGWEKER